MYKKAVKQEDHLSATAWMAVHITENHQATGNVKAGDDDLGHRIAALEQYVAAASAATPCGGGPPELSGSVQVARSPI